MKNALYPLFGSIVLVLVSGCGSSGNAPDFALSAAPTAISLTDGGSSQPLVIAASPSNGFKGTVNVAISGLPSGVTASPATVSVTAGQLAQVSLSASGAAVVSGSNVTLTATSGSLTHTASAAVSVLPAATSVSLSNNTFDFGGNLVGNVETKQVVTVVNTGGEALPLNPTVTGDPGFSLPAAQACGASLAAGASCAVSVSYNPATASTNGQTATLNLGIAGLPSTTPQTVALTGTAAVLPAGTVSSTSNPQVALYTVTLPYPGAVTVSFGPDTSYGRSTWTQSTATAGPVAIQVAGMLDSVTYHMRASVQFSNGITATDSDHTFTAKVPAGIPSLAATTTAGMTPQPGVEQLSLLNGPIAGLVVTDLQGNPIWTYLVPNYTGNYQVQGARLLPNGHFLVTLTSLVAASDPTGVNAAREIDLAGTTIREITAADLTNALHAAGYNITLQTIHHDISQLPNGHWLVLANMTVPYTDVAGFPGVSNVQGDVVIDLDETLHPVWVWNEFDHLDVNRHPYNFPDWTHTNSVVYSPTDGNLLVSMRHQNWVVKVDYQDGKGAGDILWRLGYQGDFTLVNGTDPTDWSYAQHYPSFFSANTAGNFTLAMMDNGNDRVFPAGVTCGAPGAPACFYSTIPVFQIDEGAKTAMLTSHQILPPNLFSFFGGNVELLANGNVEYDLAGIQPTGSDIFEVTQGATPETVWHMHMTVVDAYRGFRIPSLYPGVQW